MKWMTSHVSALLLVPFAMSIPVALTTAHAEKTLPTKSATLQLQNATEIPDGTLKPGSYSIRVADHLADRMIVEINDGSGGGQQKFLAVPARDFPSSVPVGPVFVTDASGKSALRGYSFAQGNAVEFVYPKKTAVELAQASGVAMLAIDPASEGMPSTKGLNSADMKIVTLWMLTPTSVGPDQGKPGISAQRYKAPASNNTERAEARPPVVSRLPKTASDLPLLYLAGFSALGLAMFLSFRRTRSASI